MDQTYYDIVDKMEKAGIDREYMLGWMGGYLQNPDREEQRHTEAYDAGFEDGSNKNTDNMDNFKA
ncbi:MAG: hypothetical protein OEZ10_07535 [Gammaproteobacteria bacterium]|nr:hypothetical protein [Gammaproteobacteria bacterium]